MSVILENFFETKKIYFTFCLEGNFVSIFSCDSVLLNSVGSLSSPHLPLILPHCFVGTYCPSGKLFHALPSDMN